MRVSSVLFSVVVVILVISLLSVWFYPSIQDFMASNDLWNGIKHLSDESGADNIDSLDELPDLPEKDVLIAIPYLDYSDEELEKMKRFVNDGGTLLLMDDYGYGNHVLAYLGMSARFSNKSLLDPLFSYKNQWLPRVTDFSHAVKENGVKSIVLNHATTLSNVEASEVIAWSSPTSYLDSNENGTRDPDEPIGPLAVAAEFRVGKGWLTLVADPSIMINSMMDKEDNDRFIRYLTHHKGEPEGIMVDRSHLTQTPLDVSKTRLMDGREMLSHPYPLLGIVALVFLAVSRYTLRKGEHLDG